MSSRFAVSLTSPARRSPRWAAHQTGGGSDRSALSARLRPRGRGTLGGGAAGTSGHGRPHQAAPAEPPRRQVRRGRGVGRPRTPRGDAVDPGGRRGGHRHRGAPGGPRPRLPEGRGPGPDQDHRRHRPLRQGARGRAEAVRGLLLPLRHPRRGEPDRTLPHRAPAGLEPARALRLLLLPGLHVRVLQRARAHGQGGPRLRGLPGRLHLRRGLLPHRPAGRGARRPGGHRRRRWTSTGPSTPPTAPTRACGSCTPAFP